MLLTEVRTRGVLGYFILFYFQGQREAEIMSLAINILSLDILVKMSKE